MRNLRLDLQPPTFDQLIDIARAAVPTVAPTWTDHNIHDPGIMLAELVAWTAEAQGYALARTRRDERSAYAKLLGFTSSGPAPAEGLVWPVVSIPSWPPGTTIMQRDAVTSDAPGVPIFRPQHAIALTNARLREVATTFSDGSVRHWTGVNGDGGTTFYPFGTPLDPASKLIIELDGTLFEGTAPPDALLSLGIEIVPPTPSIPSTNVVTTEVQRSRRIRVEIDDRSGVGPRPLRIAFDTTRELLRSGVLLLEMPPPPTPTGRFTLTLTGLGIGLIRSPRVRRIAMNVLPLVQLEAVEDAEAAFGTGLPDQTWRLQRPGLWREGIGAAIDVAIDGRRWRKEPRDDLTRCGPTEAAFSFDTTTDTVRFGNGINGSLVPAGAALQVGYRVTAGASGNVTRTMRWSVPRIAGTFGINREPFTGGADGRALSDLRRLARHEARHGRPLVTASDLEAAALALGELGVARAYEPPLEALGSRRHGAVRTLVVVAAREGVAGEESIAWLEEVRTRLAPRLPLGQRLVVVPPRYAAIRIKANLVMRPSADPATLMQAASGLLREKLAIVAQAGAASPWPFGRDPTTLMIKGWLRRVPTVAAIRAIALLLDGSAVAGESVSLGPIGLPLLVLGDQDIVIERPASRSRS